MVYVCFALLLQLQLLSVRRRTEGCSALYGHRGQGNVLGICWVNNSKLVPSELSHWFFSINKIWIVSSIFSKLYIKITFTAAFVYFPKPILFRKELTLTLIESNREEMTNNLPWPPILAFTALVLPVNVVFCCVFLPAGSVSLCAPSAGWRCQRKTWLLARAASLSTTASGSCLTTNTTFTTLPVSGERWDKKPPFLFFICNSYKQPSVVPDTQTQRHCCFLPFKLLITAETCGQAQLHIHAVLMAEN